jgi:hypothetical protein
MKSIVFSVVTSCRLVEVSLHFRRTYRLHLQDLRITQERGQQKTEALRSSETSVYFCRTTRRLKYDDPTFHSFSSFTRSMWMDDFPKCKLNWWIPELNRSQWSRGLKHEMSSPSRTQRLWVRIPFKAWMSICIYFVFMLSFLGSDLATGFIPRPRSLTDCL